MPVAVNPKDDSRRRISQDPSYGPWIQYVIFIYPPMVLRPQFRHDTYHTLNFGGDPHDRIVRDSMKPVVDDGLAGHGDSLRREPDFVVATVIAVAPIEQVLIAWGAIADQVIRRLRQDLECFDQFNRHHQSIPGKQTDRSCPP